MESEILFGSLISDWEAYEKAIEVEVWYWQMPEP